MAIVTALCLATFLLVVGAFAVDFGNAFARRQNLQTSVDLATLAAASMLPDRTAALNKAHEVLCSGKNENQVNGWDPSVCSGGTGWMDDKNLANGEVTFYTDADNNGQIEKAEGAGAGTEATAVRIQTPPAHVEFGLGSITGASGVDLTRTAMARMGSLTGPGGVQPIPVLLQETGTVCLSDTSTSTTPTGGTFFPAPTTRPPSTRPLVTLSLSPLTGIRPGDRIQVDLSLAGLANANLRIKGGTGPGDPVLNSPILTQLSPTTYTFTAPDLRPLPAHLYVYLDASLSGVNGTLITTWQAIQYVGMDSCNSVTIRRNYINETRTGTANALGLNLRLGLEHAVRPWAEFPPGNLPPVGQRQCNNQPGRGIPVRSQPVVNCLTVATNQQLVRSSRAPYLGPGGLLTGTGCPIGARTNIRGNGLDDVSMFDPLFTPGGQGGAIADAIRAGLPPTAAQVGSLSPKLFLCARLFAVPVLNAPIFNGGIRAGSYPVQGLAYLYLEPRDGNGNERPDHGFTFRGGTLTRINAIVIDPAWFPDTASLPLPIGEYLGENLTKQVALVHDFDDPGT